MIHYQAVGGESMKQGTWTIGPYILITPFTEGKPHRHKENVSNKEFNPTYGIEMTPSCKIG